MKPMSPFVGSLLVLCVVTTLATACPPPDCPDCYYWNGYECYCHEACCEDAHCGTGVEECLSCVNCVCVDDDNKCPSSCCECELGICIPKPSSDCCRDGDCPGECCRCSECNCVDDESECAWDECCVDCNCMDPVCDNCLDVNYPFCECGHGPNDVNCQSDYCIFNDVKTASCINHGAFDANWPCDKKNCDTVADGDKKAATQYAVEATDCPRGGDPIQWQLAYFVWYGCGDTCNPHPAAGACIIDCGNCSGSVLWKKYKGQKYKCGCP